MGSHEHLEPGQVDTTVVIERVQSGDDAGLPVQINYR